MAKWSRFRRLFGLEPKDDVEAEFEFHLDMRTRELIGRGDTPERARQRAMRRFGSYDHSRDACVAIDERRRRRMRYTISGQELRQDAAYALRLLRRTPGVTAMAVAALALGVGATSAIFSVVHGVLLESLPYRDADTLYRVRMLYPDGTAYTALSAPDFASVRQDARVFDEVEAYTTGTLTVRGAGEPMEVAGARISDGLLAMLGTDIALGRGFAPEEHAPGRAAVVLLTHGFWQRHYGGANDALGGTVLVGGAPCVIVGVLAPDAAIPVEAELFAPLAYDDTFSAQAAAGRRSEYLAVIGRARPGVDAAGIDAELARLGAALQTAFPGTNQQLTFNAIPLRELVVGNVRLPLLMLLGAVGFVLLVACVNVANLLLARSSARRQELSVRAALGAGRGRLFRQLITEALLLGFAGGALGLGLAYLGTTALVAAQPADIPRLDDVGLDATVVAFTLGLAIATSLVFGTLPAIQATGATLAGGLAAGARAGAGAQGHRLRSTLVVAEIAMAVVLLTGAGLLIRSFVELTRVDPGFTADEAMTFRLLLQGQEYARADQVAGALGRLETDLQSLPGVTAVGAASVLPLGGQGSILSFAVEGAPPPPSNVNAEIAFAIATPDYFRAIGTPVTGGRGLTGEDRADAPAVAVINEAGVRQWFPGEDPIGRFVDVDTRRQIVGVVGDVLQRDVGEPAAPQLFVPHAQRPARGMRVVVRTAGDPLRHAGAVRARIQALDPHLPVPSFVPLSDQVSASLARPRFYAGLLTLFAGLGLVLAATGVFGVMSYAVAQRSREISLRLALGAQPGRVLRSVIGRALLLAATGLTLGLAAAAGLGRAIQGMLFGVPVLDVLTLGSVVVVLGLVAVLASVLPARRAARLDPAGVLREN
jgi:predicted permease